VCEAERARVQRDVDFVPHGRGGGKRMERQVWRVIVVVVSLVNASRRLSVSFLSFEFGFFLLVRGGGWGRGGGMGMFAFCGGWLGGEGGRAGR
jgi:hypothetical protein